MKRINRRSAVALGLAAASAAMVKPAAAQTTDYKDATPWPGCGFRGLRPGIPIERDHAFRSKAATCSDEGGRGVVAGMRNWVRFSWLRQEWRAAR